MAQERSDPLRSRRCLLRSDNTAACSMHRSASRGPTRACARRSLGKEERCSQQLETFRRDPVGHRAHPVEPGQQPEASLAWGGVSRTAKRRQPASTPSIEPREMLTRGEPSFSRTRGPRRPPSRPGVIGPAGVKEHGIGASRLPRNLGRPELSAIHVRTGTRITNPRLAGYACWTGESKAQAQVVVSRRECKRSDARRGSGNRSASYYR